MRPTRTPTFSPTGRPTRVPSTRPTKLPTDTPTTDPTSTPTEAPTRLPSRVSRKGCTRWLYELLPEHLFGARINNVVSSCAASEREAQPAPYRSSH
jgi:hypothetical protein